MKKVWKLIVCTSYIYIYIYILWYVQNLNNSFCCVLMFKINKTFQKRLEYFSNLKKGPIVLIASLHRILSVIFEEFKFWIVSTKEQGQGRKKLWLASRVGVGTKLLLKRSRV